MDEIVGKMKGTDVGPSGKNFPAMKVQNKEMSWPGRSE